MRRGIYILQTIALALLVSCNGKTVESHDNKALIDSLSAVLYDLMGEQPEAALAMVDSLEREGVYSEGLANCRRAQIYSEQYEPRVSGIYAQRALKDKSLKRNYQYFAYNLLINSAQNVGNTERALQYATEALNATNNDTSRTAREYAPDFLVCIGSSQMKLQHRKEGNESYERAYQMYEKILVGANSFSWFYPEMMLCVDAINDNSLVGDFEMCRRWLPRLLDSYERTISASDIPSHVKDDCIAEVEMTQAKLYLREGNHQEAERHFTAFGQTNFSQTSFGRKSAAIYLKMAGRWQELEQAVETADSFYIDNDSYRSMGYLTQVLAPRFQAQQRLGHYMDALGTASKLISLLDSVEDQIDRDNAAELAVIYETQEKEQMISDQRASLSKQRWIATVVALFLVSVFFLFYTLYRRQVHKKLQQAYDQLEETTMAKERIESELRIARDIQMSMVPHEFPQRLGLDLWAQMMPAREVGGDLYGYVLQDDELYFCVGDVSGKGVPASLFMAQTVRMFHTLATQHLLPADIATKMNEEMVLSNEQGMFVTMFIAMLNLSTGHLNYCNCGHNPPILGGGEQQGVYLQMEANVPIGLWADICFVGEEIDSIKGRALFVYTDGLNEAENTRQEQFGDKRVLESLRQVRFASSRQVIEHITQEIEKHREGAEPNDDLTMMCLRIE
jgi:serine phosphatase RsbU (regulator of sigma subunit)